MHQRRLMSCFVISGVGKWPRFEPGTYPSASQRMPSKLVPHAHAMAVRLISVLGVEFMGVNIVLRDARCVMHARSYFASAHLYWSLGKRACTASTGHLVRRRCVPLATTPVDTRPAFLGSSTSTGCSLENPRSTSSMQARGAILCPSIRCSRNRRHTPMRSILILLAALVTASVEQRKAVCAVPSCSCLAGRE